jgi:hypothetical protein
VAEAVGAWDCCSGFVLGRIHAMYNGIWYAAIEGGVHRGRL